MAHRRHHRHHRSRRRNPLGINSSVIKDAAYNTAGAVGSLYVAKLLPISGGWMDVAATAISAVGVSFAGKFVGGASAQEELLKGGLTATIIQALGKLNVLPAGVGLGLYAPSYFAVPTVSDAYGRTANPFAMPALPAPAAKAMGDYRVQTRFRSRYL